jgi:hypothetical protein
LSKVYSPELFPCWRGPEREGKGMRGATRRGEGGRGASEGEEGEKIKWGGKRVDEGEVKGGGGIRRGMGGRKLSHLFIHLLVGSLHTSLLT